MPAEPHPDFEPFAVSWDLALRSDGYAENTVLTYAQAVHRFAQWLAEHHPGAGPTDIERDHLRAWVAAMSATAARNTAQIRLVAVRKFCQWMLVEGEIPADVTLGVRGPATAEPHTPVLSTTQIRELLATCAGNDFTARRDTAILMTFIDGGLRLAEVAALTVADADLRDRILFVVGKGSNRSGPRRRAVPVGVKTARALDRYLRERRRHPYAQAPGLWLGAQSRKPLTRKGMEGLVARIGQRAGIPLHAHQFRHTWASQFRLAGGEEGDLMVLGGWRNRSMLDRYGKAAADERAQASYRSRSLGDRL